MKRAVVAFALLGASCPLPTGDDDSTQPPGPECSDDLPCTPPLRCAPDGRCEYAVCPPDLAATWSEIEGRVLSISCGTGGTTCHSPEGSIFAGGLNLAADPWTALMGPDGLGAAGENVDGDVHPIRRIDPGYAEASLIVLKLSSTSEGGGWYGRGMPDPTPGSICPESLAAIRAWIDAGALRQ